MLRSKNIWRAVPMGFAALSVLLLGAAPLQAAPIIWDLTEEFSGATPPEGTLQVRLDDAGPGTVALIVDATGLVGTEFVGELLLNFDPAFSPTTLNFAGPGWTYVDLLALGTNAFKADGDGFYDIRIVFDKAPPKDRLGAGEQAEFSITRTGDGLTKEWFEFLSAPAAGGAGPFLVAAHVQGIGPDGDDSGWVTTRPPDGCVPEASTMLLFGSGLTGLLAAGRRKIRFLRAE